MLRAPAVAVALEYHERQGVMMDKPELWVNWTFAPPLECKLPGWAFVDVLTGKVVYTAPPMKPLGPVPKIVSVEWDDPPPT